MAWRQIGDKPLSEPMLTQLTDAYITEAFPALETSLYWYHQIADETHGFFSFIDP